MRKLLIAATIAAMLVPAAFTAEGDRDKEVARVQAAGAVLDEIMAAPDKGIPEEVIGSAECIAVVPSLLKGGFVVGAAYGKGVATCRTTNGWSAPAFFVVEGGSLGFQIGGQAVDYVMLIMNERGMRNLLSSKFKHDLDWSDRPAPGIRASADCGAQVLGTGCGSQRGDVQDATVSAARTGREERRFEVEGLVYAHPTPKACERVGHPQSLSS
jgi:hypothetical protein